MKKIFTHNDKKRLIQETQGRCGMCYYFSGDSTGLEIAHIIPRFIEKTDSEFNALSLCTRCHTIYDSVVVKVLKTGYTKEDRWWKNKVKDQKILDQKVNSNYEDALKQIRLMREAKINLLIQNGIFSRLELDVFKGLFQFQREFEKKYDDNSRKFCESHYQSNGEIEVELHDSKEFTAMRNNIVDELYKKYGKNLFVVKVKNHSFKLFGLDIQYHDKIHFKNLIDRKLVALECYQSEILANQSNLMLSVGMTPKGEYAEPDRILIGLVYKDKVANSFYRDLFEDLKDVVPKPAVRSSCQLQGLINSPLDGG